MATLALYTNSFPYGSGETFFETEIKFLASRFTEIRILPLKRAGDARQIPANVKVLNPVIKKKWPLWSIYFTALFHFFYLINIKELRNGFKNFPVLKCLRYFGYGFTVKKKIEENYFKSDSIHYSYWLDYSAFALALLKYEGKIDILISRAHGFDLYEERGEKGLEFTKAFTIKYINRLVLISNHGKNYITAKFPEYSGKYSLSHLGTTDNGFLNPIPQDDTLTILSCSVINENKRVGLILESLKLFSLHFPSINLNWYHIGSGEGLEKYRKTSSIIFKDSKIHCFFKGQLSNMEIFDFYRETPVDLFLNVSKMEGIPVSIMEAMSFAIPVAATNVGGISEIVNIQNGFLLEEDVTARNLAEFFYGISLAKEELWKKRASSRLFWEVNYNAQNNYSCFSAALLEMIN